MGKTGKGGVGLDPIDESPRAAEAVGRRSRRCIIGMQSFPARPAGRPKVYRPRISARRTFREVAINPRIGSFVSTILPDRGGRPGRSRSVPPSCGGRPLAPWRGGVSWPAVAAASGSFSILARSICVVWRSAGAQSLGGARSILPTPASSVEHVPLTPTRCKGPTLSCGGAGWLVLTCGVARRRRTSAPLVWPLSGRGAVRLPSRPRPSLEVYVSCTRMTTWWWERCFEGAVGGCFGSPGHGKRIC